MNTIKQIMEDNGKGIHSMFNACMHKAECCSKDDEIESLKQQLEDLSSDALVRANRIIRQKRKIVDMRQQLAESQAREARLIKFIDEVAKQTPEKPDYWSSCSQCERNSSEAEDFIALPHDDTALKEYRDAVIDDCIATTNQVLDGLEDADNVADALRVMKGGV